MGNHKFKVIRGGRSRRSKLRLRLFAFGMAVLAGFLLWNSLGHLSLLTARVTVARHTLIKTGVPVSCVVLRDEWAIDAPVTGKYIPLVEDGTRVKSGQVFARIEGEDGNYELKAPAAGLVCHGSHTVGDLPLDVLDSATVVTVANLLRAPLVIPHKSSVEAGQQVAAILDNTCFQLVTGMDFYTEGKRQTLVSPGSGREFRIIIIPREVLKHDNLFWVLWDAPTLPDSLGFQRVFSGEILTAEQELVLVPQGALYKKNDEQGVFILFRNKPIFSPVEVLYSDKGMVGVVGLGDGEQVLSLPNWASFAKRWWE